VRKGAGAKVRPRPCTTPTFPHCFLLLLLHTSSFVLLVLLLALAAYFLRHVFLI
jgi:hypothetical protein